MNHLKYKGYTGKVELSTEDKNFHGTVLDINDVINFRGESFEELEVAFKESIDSYLEFCEELGDEPEKPFSGRVSLRLTPEDHRLASNQAALEDISLNTWLCQAVREKIEATDTHCSKCMNKTEEITINFIAQTPAQIPAARHKRQPPQLQKNFEYTH